MWRGGVSGTRPQADRFAFTPHGSCLNLVEGFFPQARLLGAALHPRRLQTGKSGSASSPLSTTSNQPPRLNPSSRNSGDGRAVTNWVIRTVRRAPCRGVRRDLVLAPRSGTTLMFAP
jgi:hypothetical protein